MKQDLRNQPWWTEADRAELNLFTHELVNAFLTHRDKHGTRCNCDFASKAVGAFLDWREGRILRSKAEWLRALQEAA